MASTASPKEIKATIRSMDGRHPWKARLAKVLLPARDRLHFFGDSHVRSAHYAYATGSFGFRHCEFFRTVGASARGLGKTQSLTGAGTLVRANLLPHRRGIVPVLQFGEVDCGVTAWSCAERDGTDVFAEAENSIRSYARLLEQIIAAGYSQLLVLSVIPPILEDQSSSRLEMQRNIRASWKDRSALTKAFNESLRRTCIEVGAVFVDVTNELVDDQTDNVHARYLYKAGNHHLNPATAGQVWARAILAALK